MFPSRRRTSLFIRAVASLLLTALLAPAASAEPGFHLGLRLGTFDGTQFSDTYDALYGSNMSLIGIQAEYRFERPWFLRLAVDSGSVDGELVILDPQPVPTGTPTELSMTPVHLTAGWILKPENPWSIYLGGGPSFLSWDEKSDITDDSGSDPGLHLLGGVRRNFDRWSIGGEILFSSIPDAIGQGGASAAFGEDDLGGLALTAVAGYSF